MVLFNIIFLFLSIAFMLFIHARAHDGEANKAVVESLAKYFHISKSQVEIVSGLKSKKKIIEIS